MKNNFLSCKDPDLKPAPSLYMDPVPGGKTIVRIDPDPQPLLSN
mgnify:CR=1 FL=1